MQKILKNKVAIITGATEGIGFEISKRFIFEGANLVICSRDKIKVYNAFKKLNKICNLGQKVFAIDADISKESDVKKVVNCAINNFNTCDILVNNAGIYGPKGKIEEVNWDEWTKTVEINLFGSIMMCRFIIPYFKKKKYGKIIQLSGGGATSPMPNITAYAASKAAIVRFAESLSKELEEFKIDVNSIAPGALNTKMLDEIIIAGPKKVGVKYYNNAIKQKKNGGSSINMSLDLAVFLASTQSDGITGKLISAIWDNWKDWHKHIDELSNSDIYTIRRIIGRDRGFVWGDK